MSQVVIRVVMETDSTVSEGDHASILFVRGLQSETSKAGADSWVWTIIGSDSRSRADANARRVQRHGQSVQQVVMLIGIARLPFPA